MWLRFTADQFILTWHSFLFELVHAAWIDMPYPIIETKPIMNFVKMSMIPGTSVINFKAAALKITHEHARSLISIAR